MRMIRRRFIQYDTIWKSYVYIWYPVGSFEGGFELANSLIIVLSLGVLTPGYIRAQTPTALRVVETTS